MTLPNADGTNGQVISTNGSGVLSWTSNGVTSLNVIWTLHTFNLPDASTDVVLSQQEFKQFTGGLIKYFR
jgi:hypothetical protein